MPRVVAQAVAAVFLVVLAGCDSVPLTAPTRSTISLFSSASQVALEGTLDITATVIEPAGTTVQNGTVVTFTASLGRVEPSEARTNNGKVTVKFYAGTVSGTAEINAFSGGASTSGGSTSGGSGGTTPAPVASGTGPLRIKVGGAAASKIAVSATPSVLASSGGTAQVVAVVTDESGTLLGQVPVTFVTTAGTLSSGSANTDANGEARVTLTTNREAEVTARVGAAEGKVTVRLGSVLALGITPPATIQAGVPANFSFSVTAPAAGSATVREVSASWGDGTSTNLGALTGSVSVSHTYFADGNFTVTLTATDSSGERFSTSTSVAAVPAQVQVNITADDTLVPKGTEVVFTVTVTPSTTRVLRYEFDFSDGPPVINGSTATQITERHRFNVEGVYKVKVTVVTPAASIPAETVVNVTVS
jgi:PKD repeat protein